MSADPEPVVLDLRGLKCPLPVLRTRKALRKLTPGSVLVATATDPMAVIDIPHMLRQTGDILERQESEDGATIFYIRRAGGNCGAGIE